MPDQLYDQGDRFTRITTAGTGVLRTTPTRLKRVVVNTFVAASNVSVYNGVTAASGQRVALIGTATDNTQGDYNYDVALSGGLTVVVVGTPDITVVYQ